jgi:hypothetical protein
MHVIPSTRVTEAGVSKSKSGLGKSMRPYLKKKLKAKDWGVAQVVVTLPSKHEALSSIPRATKRKRSQNRSYTGRRWVEFYISVSKAFLQTLNGPSM